MSETPMFESMAKAGRPDMYMSDQPMPMAKQGGAPIAVALDQQDTEVANLIDEVHILLDKIRPVMGPEGAEAADKMGNLTKAPVSDVTNRININSIRLGELRRTVRTARDRVEL